MGVATVLALVWGGWGHASAVGADRSVAPAAAATADDVAEILIVGDSITHASVGDYSWRYFAWKHLESTDAQVDFVGPKRDPHVEPGSKWKPRYNLPAFDQDHAATWGDRIAYQTRHDRTALMTQYRPDVVVLELGANDIAWMKLKPKEILPWARNWVLGARMVVPSVDIVLVEIPWSTNARAKAYNKLLGKLADELDDPGARVVVARAAKGYRTGSKNGKGDTYDPLHPNTRGQVKIAAAVSDALATIGIGERYPRPLVFPAEGPRVRPVLKGRASTRTAKWRWSVPPGATAFDVSLRHQGKSWVRVGRARSTTTYRVKNPKRCEAQTLRVRARKGWTLAGKDMTSRSLTLRVGPKVTGRAKLRWARARKRGVAVSWRAKKDACAYEVRAVGTDTNGKPFVTRGVATASERSTVLRGLRKGHEVRVQVRARGARNATGWSRPMVVRTR